jgi:uncharacterized protein YciW
MSDHLVQARGKRKTDSGKTVAVYVTTSEGTEVAETNVALDPDPEPEPESDDRLEKLTKYADRLGYTPTSSEETTAPSVCFRRKE